MSAFLDAIPHGPQALLLQGEAGIGNSTVWFEAVRLADAQAYRVLRARPAESEARLSYAVLADIVGPVFDETREPRCPHHRNVRSPRRCCALRRTNPLTRARREGQKG